MAELTEEKIIEAVERLKKTFADGFQLEDVAVVVEEIVVFAGLFKLSGPEKRELALRVAGRVLDETDTPMIPDWFVDPLIKKFLPNLIDLIVKTSKGEVINKPG